MCELLFNVMIYNNQRACMSQHITGSNMNYMFNHTLDSYFFKSLYSLSNILGEISLALRVLKLLVSMGFVGTSVMNLRTSPTKKCFYFWDLKYLDSREEDSSRKILMTHHDPVQPQIKIGLHDQRSILNQLYQLALNTAWTREELERT